MASFNRKFTFGNLVIVLLFALSHFAVAVLSRSLHYHDDILLTILTIAMVVVISIRNSTRVEMVALLTLVATISGFIIGSWLWQPLAEIMSNNYLAPALSTFLITTVLGLAVNYLTLYVKRFRTKNNVLSSYIRNVVLIAVGILLLRLSYALMIRSGVYTEGTLLSHVMATMENTWALLTLLAGNIMLVMRTPLQSGDEKNRRRTLTSQLIISILTLPVVAALLIHYDVPHFDAVKNDPVDFVRALSAALMIDIVVVAVCILIRISTISQRELREERELKHRTEYQYERLKQQINPHFLFNSLGILDYLVQEHETERASSFIRKLANIYRYMLKNDNKPLVKLSEEMDFTRMYIDLLKERFTEGMVVEIDIERELHDRYIVPCAVQLLVENATKHNIVSAEQPLTINITTEEGMLVVRNRLQLRTHGQPSTRLGLENIRRQYQDITRRDISVEKTDSEFIVKLPIV
jgi:hypothetical protein